MSSELYRCTDCAYDSVRVPSCPAICFVDMIVVAADSNLKMGSPDVHGRPLCQALIDDGSKVKTAPVHPDFGCGFWPLSLMGSAG